MSIMKYDISETFDKLNINIGDQGLCWELIFYKDRSHKFSS